jgi:hypothetical protein
VLQALPSGRHTPLVLPAHRLTRSESAAVGSGRTRHPAVEVERPLAAYTELASVEVDA